MNTITPDCYLQWVVDFNSLAITSFNFQVIDFDPYGATIDKTPKPSTLLNLLNRAERILEKTESKIIETKLHGHIAILKALSGQRTPIDKYVKKTMGCSPLVFCEKDIQNVIEAITHLANIIGCSCDHFLHTKHPVEEVLFDTKDVVQKFRERFTILGQSFKKEFGIGTDFRLEIQQVEEDAYWSYWVDGINGEYRLRLNRSEKKYTLSEVDQFVLHELVAHCCQMASWQESVKKQELETAEVITSVHTYEQPLLEGIAQALPLMMTSFHDPLVQGRALRDLLHQMLLSKIYLAIETGADPITQISSYSKFLTIENEERFLRNLFQYQNTPQLRAYMHAYPLGFFSIFENYLHGPLSCSSLVKSAFFGPMRLNEEMVFEST